uniref:Uncharacterized protein n=1 Tax=Arundo donax TaxID=35708 RepID=A0A0A8YAS6_ARUDO
MLDNPNKGGFVWINSERKLNLDPDSFSHELHIYKKTYLSWHIIPGYSCICCTILTTDITGVVFWI